MYVMLYLYYTVSQPQTLAHERIIVV